jgi:hypothetical protein
MTEKYIFELVRSPDSPYGSDLCWVRVVVGEKEGFGFFDTGSGITCVNQDIIPSLGFKKSGKDLISRRGVPTSVDKYKDVTGIIGDGFKFGPQVVRADNLGRKRLMLIGMDILKRGIFTLDWKNRLATFEV